VATQIEVTIKKVGNSRNIFIKATEIIIHVLRKIHVFITFAFGS